MASERRSATYICPDHLFMLPSSRQRSEHELSPSINPTWRCHHRRKHTAAKAITRHEREVLPEMGLSFEVSTLVLLFAPLFLPKLFSVAGRLLSASASSESAHPKHTHATSRVAISKSSWKQRFLPSNYLKVAPAILLAVYTVLSLVYLKPFNLFTSLGQLPITAPAGQIQLALSRFGLLDKYADDLNLLTSLDRRVLYLHYGHSNFVGCQQLLGSTAPRDLLAYSSIRILQGAVGKGLLLALSNRRWKVSLFIASIAVALYQIYALATTTPQISNPEEAYLTVSCRAYLLREIRAVLSIFFDMLDFL